jgi:hypothetical protein
MKFLSFLLRFALAAALVALVMALAIIAGIWFYRSPAGAAVDQWGPRTYILMTCGLMLLFVLLARRQKFGRMLGGVFRHRRPASAATGTGDGTGTDETRARIPRRIAAYRERRGGVTGLRRRS